VYGFQCQGCNAERIGGDEKRKADAIGNTVSMPTQPGDVQQHSKQKPNSPEAATLGNDEHVNIAIRSRNAVAKRVADREKLKKRHERCKTCSAKSDAPLLVHLGAKKDALAREFFTAAKGPEAVGAANSSVRR
jgi:hypothetical protein